MAALIREPPRGGTPGAADLAPRLARRARRLRDRARLGRRRPPPGSGLLERRLDRGDHRVPPPRVRRRRRRCRRRLMPPKGLEPSGIILVDKPAGPSSFAIVARVRSRTGTKMGHAGTLDPFATGLLLLLSGRSTKLAGSFVGLDKRYLTDVDLTARTSTGDPEGEVVERLAAPDAGRSSSDGSRPSAARSSCRSRPRRRSRSAVSARTSCTAAASRSRCRCGARSVHALDVIAYTDGVVRLDLRVSSGTYVRAIAEALGGHCATLAPARDRPVQRRGRRRGAGDPGRRGAGAAAMSDPQADVAVAIGTFDGVHLGHRRVIEEAVDDRAARAGADLRIRTRGSCSGTSSS